MTDDPRVDCGTSECDLHGGANVCVRGSRTRVLASARVCACAIVVFAHSYSSIAPCNSDGKGREG